MGRLGRLGILDLLSWQDVPVLFKCAGGLLGVINQNLEIVLIRCFSPYNGANLVLVVGSDNQGVDVGRLVILALDVLVDQVILALVVEDDVHLLRRVATDVRAEHDVVLGLAVHSLGGDIRGKDLSEIE